MNIQSVTLKTASALIAVAMLSGGASAEPLLLSYTNATTGYANVNSNFAPDVRDENIMRSQPSDEVEDFTPSNPALRRQIVPYATSAAAGTIIVDTPNTFLYYVLGGGKAVRYGIGVGREGFTWSGSQAVTRKAEWPDWSPPPEMIARQPYLPRWVGGGEGNPLGARAIYLGSTAYRIHGTNAPDTIGKKVSSGCIRMLNADVIDLYSRVNVGTKVTVLPARGNVAAAASPRPSRATVRPHDMRVSGVY